MLLINEDVYFEMYVYLYKNERQPSVYVNCNMTYVTGCNSLKFFSYHCKAVALFSVVDIQYINMLLE